ncbi:MAG: yjcC2 [Haloplasmataceae bacterium]|jgi:hypothetical protein|nr:yjcC2 [Haloplasmataceae bacterium]
MGYKNIFDDISKNNNIDKDAIFNIADSIKNKNLQDEKVLRKLIHDISKIAGKPVSKELEDKLVEKIRKDGVPKNFSDFL